MNAVFDEIKKFLKNQDIKFKISDNDDMLYLPYTVNNINTDVFITFSNNVIMLIFNIQSSKDIHWCNQFNLKHIIPRASRNETNKNIILDCIYDLNIFPKDYIEKWFRTALFVCLDTVKENFTQSKKDSLS